MSKYYKDSNNQLYVDPILEKHQGLVEITQDEFMALANPPKTEEQLMKEKIATFTSYVDEVIFAEIQAYNEANGVAFSSPESFTKYAIQPTSPLNAVSISFLEWFDELWAKARQIQADVLAGTIEEPSEVGFKAMLPLRA